MSGDSIGEELPELRRQDLLLPHGDLAQVVAVHGRAEGIGLLEAFLRTFFKPEPVKEALHFYTTALWAAEAQDERTALLIWGQLIRLMEEAADAKLAALFRVAVSQGLVSAWWLPPGQRKHTMLDTATAMRAVVNVWAGYLTEGRGGSPARFNDILLKPTAKATSKLPLFDRAAAFTAALDGLGCYGLGEGVRNGHRERVITETKRQLFDYLNEKHPKQFGTLGTFAHNYTRNGEWADQLDFPISWASDSHRDKN